jgi:hypothetical protein
MGGTCSRNGSNKNCRVYAVLVGIREREIPLERTRHTLKDNTKINLKRVRQSKALDLLQGIQDWGQRRSFVKSTEFRGLLNNTFQELQCIMEFRYVLRRLLSFRYYLPENESSILQNLKKICRARFRRLHSSHKVCVL